MEPSFTFECQNMWTCQPGKQNQEAYVLQAAEALVGGKGRYKIINKPTEKNVNSFGTDCLDNLSVTKMPTSSLNWANFTTYHFQNSESSSLEQKHFPMFDINRKIETILGPIKRTSYGTTKVRMSGRKLHVGESSLPHHLIEFASEEQQLQQQIVADTLNQEMGTSQQLQQQMVADTSNQEMGTSQQLQQQMVADTSNQEMGTSESRRDYSPDHLSSKLVCKNQFANTNVTYQSHELCNYSHSASMVSEMKNDNERFLGSIGSSQTRPMDGSKSCPLDIPQSPSSGEDGRESRSSSHIRLMRGSKSIPGLIKPNEMENCCNVRSVRTENTLDTGKEDSLEYANGKHLWFTKKKGTDLCHEDQMVGESAVSANVKGTSFFERLTLPALPHNHGQQAEISLPLMGSASMKDSDGHHINFNFKDKGNERSVKIDTMCVDAPLAPNPPEVGTSSNSQKDVACCSLNLPEIAGTNLMLMYNKDMATLRSESMDAAHLSCTGKPSSPMEKKLRDSDATWKWIKRLRSEKWITLDSSPISTKRFKLGDVSSGVEAQNLVTRLASHNGSISNLPQSHQLVKTNLLPKSVQSCSEDSVMDLPWVQRWCHQSQEMTPLPITCVPENSNVLPENLEAKQFPSLAAMALMGKSVNNFRPCEFQRRGSTIVWNTEKLL